MANIANVNVNVSSNASTAIPQQVAQGYNAAQKFINSKPLNISVNTQGLRGLNDAHLALGRISTSAQDFDKSIKAATSRTISFALAVGAIETVRRSLSALVSTSIDVEKRLKDIQVIAGGTAEEFRKLSSGIFDAARKTSTSFKDASDAALEFARQGNTVSQAIQKTTDALSLSRIAGLEAAKSVETITAALNTFQDQLTSSTQLVDKFVAVDTSFAVSSRDLAEGIGRVGATAQEAGVSIDQVIGAITALQSRTARGGPVVSNALKSIFTRTGRPENVATLNALGVATEDVTGKSRNAIDVLKDLAQVYQTLGDAQKRQIGEQFAGLYQINQFQALIKDLSSQYSILDAATQKSADSQGAAASRIAQLNTTTAALFEQTKTNLTQLASQIGQLSFESPLKSFLSTVTGNDSFLKSITDLLGRAADPSISHSFGEKLAKGFLQGIGNFIGGPGLVFLSAILKSALSTAFSFIGESLKSALGINRAIQEQAALQNQVNNALARASEFDVQRIKNAATLNEQLALTVQLVNAQASAAGTFGIGTSLYQAGVRSGANNTLNTKKTKIFASGYTPVREEINAVRNSSDYVGARSARPQILPNFSIGGRRQDVVINSAEKVVPTKAIYGGYSGPDQYSILNPKQQKMLGFNSGYYPKVPNLVDTRFLSSFKEILKDAKKGKYIEEAGATLAGKKINGIYNSKLDTIGVEKNLGISDKSDTLLHENLHRFAVKTGIQKTLTDDIANFVAPKFLEGTTYPRFKSGSYPPNQYLSEAFADLGKSEPEDKKLILGYLGLSDRQMGTANKLVERLRKGVTRGVISKEIGKLHTLFKSSGYIPNLARRALGTYGYEDILQYPDVFGSGGTDINTEQLKELLKRHGQVLGNIVNYPDIPGLESFGDQENKLLELLSRHGQVLGGNVSYPTNISGRNVNTNKLISTFRTGKQTGNIDSTGINNIAKIFGRKGQNLASKLGVNTISGGQELTNLPLIPGAFRELYFGKEHNSASIIKALTNAGILNDKGQIGATDKFSAISLQSNQLKNLRTFFKRRNITTNFANGYIPNLAGRPSVSGKLKEMALIGLLSGSAGFGAGEIGSAYYDRLISDPPAQTMSAQKMGIPIDKRSLERDYLAEIKRQNKLGDLTSLSEPSKIIKAVKKIDFSKIGSKGYEAGLIGSLFGGLGGIASLFSKSKTLQNLFKTQKARKLDKIQSFATGFSPAVNDAIKRESKYVDRAKIYISHVNTPSYTGPVVANTRDEPNRQSLLKAANNYRGFDKGYVPNLVDSRDAARQLERERKLKEVLTKISAGKILSSSDIDILRNKFEDEAIREQKNVPVISNILKKGQTPQTAYTALSQSAKSGNQGDQKLLDEIKKNINLRIEDQKQKAASIAEQNKLTRESLRQIRIERAISKRNQNISDFTRRLNEEVGKVNIFQLLFGTPEQIVGDLTTTAKIPKNKNTNALRKAQSEALLSVQNKKQNAGNIGGITLGIGAPIAAGLVDSFGGDRSSTRLISSSLQGAGFGASLGGFFGLPGLAVGAGLGGFLGAAGAIVNEPEIQRNKKFQKKLSSIEKQEGQIDTGRQIIQAESALKDLTEQGASPRVISTQLRNLQNLKTQLTPGGKISKIFNSEEDIPTQDELEKQIEDLTKRGQEALQKKNNLAIKKSLEDIKLQGGRIEESTPKSEPFFNERVQERLRKNKTTNLLEEDNKDLREEIVKNIVQNVKTGSATSSQLKGVLGSSTSEGILSGLQQFLPKEQLDKLQKEFTDGIEESRSKFFILSKTVEAFAEKIENDQKAQELVDKALKQAVNKGSLNRNLNFAFNQRQLGNVQNVQTRETEIFGKNAVLQQNSPFLSELEKGLENNRIDLQKGIGDIQSQRESAFSNLIQDVVSKVPDNLFTKLADQLTNLSKSTPNNFNDNFKSLTDKIGELEVGGETLSKLGISKDNFNTQQRILDEQLNTLKKQNDISRETAQKLDKIATNTAAFGGLRGLLTGNRIPSGTATGINSGARARLELRELPAKSIIGTQERNRRQRDINIAAGVGQLSAADKLKSAGFDNDFIKKVVNPQTIAKGNQNSIEKILFNVSEDLVKDSPLFSNSDIKRKFESGQKEALRTNDLKPIIDAIKGTNIKLPQNVEIQKDLIKALESLEEAFKTSGEKAKTQVNSEFNISGGEQSKKRLLPSIDSQIEDKISGIKSQQNFRQKLYGESLQPDTQDLANTSIIVENRLNKELENLRTQRLNVIKNEGVPENYNKLNINTTEQDVIAPLRDSLNTLAESLRELIGPLGDLVKNQGQGNNEENGNNNFATININANGDSGQNNALFDKISDALNSLNYKISTITKQTKAIIPPSANNPFGNINNSSITL